MAIPVNNVPGFHITYVHCLNPRCERVVGRYLAENALLGAHKRLVCRRCGHRGAFISMSWVVGTPPPIGAVMSDRVPAPDPRRSIG